ncbi:MAG: ATPase domain-containing protein [Methanomassiliicoccus sp.]|nr:ATPase domain-containing protein [Methanomassiliicoccus sp.]
MISLCTNDQVSSLVREGFGGAMSSSGLKERCVTGIEGLDSILGGGFPRGSLVLVTGVPGVGKTSLALEFAFRGAAMGEKSLILTTVERPAKLVASVPEFDFYDPSLVKSGMLEIKEISELSGGGPAYGSHEVREQLTRLGESIASYIAENKVRRLVIDTYHTIFYGVKDETPSRDLLLSISEAMYDNDCTGILVTDANPSTSIESVIVDGVVVLGNYERRSDLLRTLQVLKMKATSHSRAKYVIDITDCGVLITPMLRGGA